MRQSSLASQPDHELKQHRIGLTARCYRMLASPFEAEDAVRETLLRAWRRSDRFEGRASLRSWLYSIATNVCLDMLGARQRRARPMDLGPAQAPIAENLRTLLESHLAPAGAEPWKAAEVAELLETSVASVNSALQRARSTLEATNVTATESAMLIDTETLFPLFGFRLA